MVWLRVAFPRLRIDQLMSFAWKFLFPLALVNLLVIGVEVYGFGIGNDIPWWMLFVNSATAVVLVLVFSRFYKLGGGRVEVEA
jgi:NADH-quinone oxidoreductase subunit H